MIQRAVTSGISLREYVATLTALIQANGRAASAQVGDGAGVDGADVMRQGRWRSPAMVACYTRAVEAGATGKWL